MVLRPIRRAVVPSPLEEADKFDEFVTQYLNKCDDLLSYTQRYPTVKTTECVQVQRQNRNPHETHRWLRRTVAVPAGVTYGELRTVLFANRAEHLPRWVPHLVASECVEAIVPNLCEAVWLGFRSPGLQARRDYCQMVVKREFVGEDARPKPRIFTPSASIANLAQAFHSQSTLTLSRPPADSSPLPPPPQPAQPTDGYFGAADRPGAHNPAPHGHARLDSGWQPGPQSSSNGSSSSTRDGGGSSALGAVPVRRFQIVTVPMAHRACPPRRGYVRAVYEAYEEIREYADARVEWISIYHSDMSGWVPAFVADRSVANAFPKEAHALLDYVQMRRPRPA